jgi:acetyl-CoA acyltransferase
LDLEYKKDSAMSLPAVYVIDALRTPIGRFRGGLAHVRSDDLAAHVITSLLARQPAVHPRIDHVIFGATNQAGEDNRNVARMASLLAGLPYEVPAVTVNRLCGSGMEAIQDAARMIMVGAASAVVAGGVESMTRAPWVIGKSHEAFQRVPPPMFDTSLGWRFPNPKMAERFELQSMGETAENVGKKSGISREEQDAFALASHQKAAAAWEAGKFQDEVVSVTVPQAKKAALIVDKDESIRADSSMAALAKLKAVFRQGGTVTAGNSSPINDGAAAVLLVSEEVVKAEKLQPMARLVSSATAGVDPNYMGEGPIPATRKALSSAGLRAPNVDLVELNEAFAAQSIACMRALELDPERVNVNGGAIALGHPIGASGARIVATLIHEMKRRGSRHGLATLCIGVGQGIATLFEKA